MHAHHQQVWSLIGILDYLYSSSIPLIYLVFVLFCFFFSLVFFFVNFSPPFIFFCFCYVSFYYCLTSLYVRILFLYELFCLFSHSLRFIVTTLFYTVSFPFHNLLFFEKINSIKVWKYVFFSRTVLVQGKGNREKTCIISKAACNLVSHHRHHHR